MSGFFLHIKCGRGRREHSEEIEAAGGTWAPAPRQTAAPKTRAPAVLSASLLDSRCHSPRPQKERGCFSEIEKGERSRSGAKSPGSVAPAVKMGHSPDWSEAPSHRRLQRTDSCSTSPPHPPAGPTPRGGTGRGSAASSPLLGYSAAASSSPQAPPYYPCLSGLRSPCSFPAPSRRPGSPAAAPGSPLTPPVLAPPRPAPPAPGGSWNVFPLRCALLQQRPPKGVQPLGSGAKDVPTRRLVVREVSAGQHALFLVFFFFL